MQTVEGKYVIVCSRGPGSETIITQSFQAIRKDDGKLYHDEDAFRVYLTEEEEMSDEEVVAELEEFDNDPIPTDTLFGIEVMWQDEGPVLFTDEFTTDEDIYKCLVHCFAINEQELDFDPSDEEGDEELKTLLEDMYKAKIEIAGAFASAVLRSWLNPGVWTSVNAWRNLECEVLTKEDVDRYCKFADIGVADLEIQGCGVLAECAKRYPDNLPSSTSGC